MTYRRYAIVLFSSAALFFSAVAGAETRRAVIIGINSYFDSTTSLVGRGTPPDPRFWLNLNGAVNDSVRVRDILVARYGFERGDIVYISDRDATRNAIISAIEDHLIAKTRPGDVAFFYYAGHGSRVRNTLSTEEDKLDESIVPADASTGARDIRDRELRDLFNKVIDKGGELTVVLDSCHSGSATRGPSGSSSVVTRMLPMDPRDVKDGSTAPSPADRGALVISATQKDQLAHEGEDEHGYDGGVFSMALLRALRTAEVDEPAQNIFRRISAQMKASGYPQAPDIEGTDERKGRSFFGGEGSGETGRSVASVQSVDDGVVTLQEGISAGFTRGSELTKVNNPDVRIRIMEVDGLVRSIAEIRAGAESDINAGDLFVVDKWAPPDVPNLHVWIPSVNLSATELAEFAEGLQAAAASKGYDWITDPTLQVPSHILRHTDEGWELADELDNRHALGQSPSIDGIAEKLDPSGGAIYVNLPAPAALEGAIQLGDDSANNSIAMSNTRRAADYHLVGRFNNGKLGYAWLRPQITSPADSAMPWITRWTDLEGPVEIQASKVATLAVKLGYINAWLRLEGPPKDPAFPYELVLKARDEDRFVTGGEIREGDRYSLAIHGPQNMPDFVAWRYVYVFALDRNGKSTLVFPQGGFTENRYPPEEDKDDPKQTYILPKSNFKVSKPFGMDTFVLVATNDRIPDLTVFNSGGVRSPVITRGTVTLTDLLRNVGTNTRGTELEAVPTQWSIQRLYVVSAAQGP
jgi:hypothetical protein